MRNGQVIDRRRGAFTATTPSRALDGAELVVVGAADVVHGLVAAEGVGCALVRNIMVEAAGLAVQAWNDVMRSFQPIDPRLA